MKGRPTSITATSSAPWCASPGRSLPFREQMFPTMTFRWPTALKRWRGERTDVEYLRILHLGRQLWSHGGQRPALLLEAGEPFDRHGQGTGEPGSAGAGAEPVRDAGPEGLRLPAGGGLMMEANAIKVQSGSLPSISGCSTMGAHVGVPIHRDALETLLLKEAMTFVFLRRHSSTAASTCWPSDCPSGKTHALWATGWWKPDALRVIAAKRDLALPRQLESSTTTTSGCSPPVLPDPRGRRVRGALHTHRRTLRTPVPGHHVQPGLLPVGAHLRQPNGHGGGHRPGGPPLGHPGIRRPQLPWPSSAVETGGEPARIIDGTGKSS